MSAALTLSLGAKTEYTMVSNAFIDRYMPQANGSYVKVYLYFLRLLCDPSHTGSISAAAELLDETEKDIGRALGYWEKEGLVKLTRGADTAVTEITFLPIPELEAADSTIPEPETAGSTTSRIPARTKATELENTSISSAPAQNRFEKPDYSEAQITALTSLDEVKWLMARLEQTLGRLLKPADLQTLLFLYESIGFPAELIAYLYEYCASKNKKSASYIEAVGIAWAKSGVDTIEKAELETTTYNQNYTVVNRAFGLNRAPGSIEMKYIRRWADTFGFDNSIIEEACNRTMLSTSKPDFKYADKILTSWHEAGIKKKGDIAVLDSEFARKNAAANAKARENFSRTTPPPQNRFGAFPQRCYTTTDYSEMEGRLLRKDTTHAN